MISKDESIVNQVAAKIAGDFAVQTGGGNIDTTLANFDVAYPHVYGKLSEVHGFGLQQHPMQRAATAVVNAAFPGTTEVEPFTDADMTYPKGNAPAPAPSGLRIKGDQYGPLPDWLFAAAAEAGVSEVYDNRNQLAENNKRPWFRGTGGKDAPAFWPPKGR